MHLYLLHFLQLKKNVATDLAKSLDLTSDPCQDFFQFACGNWLNQHQPIPKSKPEWTEYDILDAKLNTIITGKLTGIVQIATCGFESKFYYWC